MELMVYLRILWRRKVVVVSVTLIAILVTGAAIMLVPRPYTASVTVRVAPVASGTIQSAQLLYSERIINTYAQLANTRMVMLELASRVGFDPNDPPEIKAEVIAETELLKISVKHSKPDIARNTANELANMLMNERIAKDMRVSVIEPAGTPKATSYLTLALYAFLGVMVGLAGGSGLAFVLENLDTRLYTPEQIADIAELPILGKVPFIKGHHSNLQIQDILYNEAFRIIRANLLSLSQEKPIQTLLVTSAEPEEGKSLTTAYLALSLAQTNRTVVAVDADFHRSRLHEIFEIPNEHGLSSVLAGEMPLIDAVHNGPCPNLHVLTSGPRVISSPDQFYSTRIGDLLKQLANRFDVIVLDTPPVQALTDAVELAALVDGVVLVAACERVDRDALALTCHQLVSVGATILGIIVNRVKPTTGRRYRAYY